MTTILPSNVYKDINAAPYSAPTLPADPVRNDMSEEHQKMLAKMEHQLAGMKIQLDSLESELARIEVPYSFEPKERILRTAIDSLYSAIAVLTKVIEMTKAELNRVR